jgi:protein TonB
MFEQSILAHENVAHKTRALAASFGVQTLVVGVALLIPLVFGDHMPQVQLFTKVAAPTRLQPEPVTQTQTASTRSAPSMFRAPAKIFALSSATSKPAGPYVATIISDSGPLIGDGFSPIGLPKDIGSVPLKLNVAAPTQTHQPAPIAKAPDKPQVVTSEIQASKLIRKIMPEYPSLAKQARVSGTVRLTSVIAKDGRIEQLQVISGNPLLIPAALAAVKQWLYSPTFLNGQAVEVIAPIDVIFTLSQ